jgi:hypothetical protein
MIFGAHVIVCSRNAEADRAFFRLKSEIASLAKKGFTCSQVQEARWGSITKIRLPGGGDVGLYQPKHPTALDLK